MDKKQKILELRERLDKTLAMPDLVNKESIKSLVKDHLLRSSFCGNEGNIGNVVEKRTMEVSNILQMLRSASGKNHMAVKGHNSSYNEWKVKQDTDQLRVMYREGPHGTPYHTLLAEGYADGPIDVCLCVSWETTLYKKWWPQYNIPSFKITSASCLQKVCIGEEISLIRVKVAWPVSDREALLHYFEIEYLKEDLIIVLLNTISDLEHIDVNTHGFSRDGIPEAKDTVRIDLVGGLVLQKIDSNRSYFRVIANMDIKLDFVPPTLINFVARQLIGNGHKLYQKAVGSVATSDEDYGKALQRPMYVQIREGLDSSKKHNSTLVVPDEERSIVLPPEKRGDDDTSFIEISPVTEIVEEETDRNLTDSLIDVVSPTNEHASKENPSMSPEVERALKTLDQAISFLRGHGLSNSNQSDCFSINQGILSAEAFSKEVVPENISNMGTKPSNAEEVSLHAEGFRDNKMDSAPHNPREGEDDYRRGFTVSNKTTLASHEKSTAEGTVTLTQPPISESMRKVCDEDTLVANGYNGGPSKSNFKQGNKKKQGKCCLNLSFFRS